VTDAPRHLDPDRHYSNRQLDGFACIECGAEPAVMRPAGIGPRGQLFHCATHPEYRPELTQAEINALEQTVYDAEDAGRRAADLLMDLMADLKRDRPGSYRFIVETFSTVGRLPGVDDLVTEWTAARDRERDARRALPYN